MECFQVRYDSRVVIYERKFFITLATALPNLPLPLKTRKVKTTPQKARIVFNQIILPFQNLTQRFVTLGSNAVLV